MAGEIVKFTRYHMRSAHGTSGDAPWSPSQGPFQPRPPDPYIFVQGG